MFKVFETVFVYCKNLTYRALVILKLADYRTNAFLNLF